MTVDLDKEAMKWAASEPCVMDELVRLQHREEQLVAHIRALREEWERLWEELRRLAVNNDYCETFEDVATEFSMPGRSAEPEDGCCYFCSSVVQREEAERKPTPFRDFSAVPRHDGRSTVDPEEPR